MILFLNDWKHYPRAIVDTKTTNQSFLAMADRYRRMGIKNYFFMLALHNPELQGVDPFDPNLTKQQKIDIAYECRTNIWYFLREVARLPPVSGIEPIRFIANRGNLAIIWLFLNHITGILIQPRQTGKSGSIDILTLWLIDVATNNTKMLMLTKDTALMSDAISRIKGMRELLPNYIYQKDKNDSDNKSGLNNAKLNNEYKTGVARSNKQAANNLGRGMTTAITHIDEVPFITHIDTTLPAALTAGNKARRDADANGMPWGIIFTTTAGRRDDRDGGYVYNEIVSKAMVWNEVLFDCLNTADAGRMVDRNCTGRMQVVDVTMSHRQLGYTDKWLYDSIRAVGGTREANERDFLNIWNSGSQRSPLTAELNSRIHKSVLEPKMTEVTRENFLIRWYVDGVGLESLAANSRLVMGLDSSEAAGRDAIAMVLVDVATLAVVGAATVNKANLIEFAHWLGSFLVDHPEVTLVPELKSTGQTIVDMLLLYLPQHGVDPFKRIYNGIVNDARSSSKADEAYAEILRPVNMRDSFFYTERKRSFGFKTNAALRELIFGAILQEAARDAGTLVYDKTLATEILGLQVRNERVDHSIGNHDDHVVAWLLCHWFIRMGTNLQHYGIRPGLALSAMSQQEADKKSDLERWKEDRQIEHLEEIDKIIAALSDCENEALVSLYERKLHTLSRRVEASGMVKNFSVDEVMERVSKERDKRTRLSNSIGTADPEAHLREQIWDTIHTGQRQMYRGFNQPRW